MHRILVSGRVPILCVAHVFTVFGAVLAVAPCGPAQATKRKPKAKPENLQAIFFPAADEAEKSVVDGSAAESWQGPGGAQARISQTYLAGRDEKLATAQALIDEMFVAIGNVNKAESTKHKGELRRRLRGLAEAPLQQVGAELGEAIDLETKRLKLLRKAVAVAEQRRAAPPEGMHAELLMRMYEPLADGRRRAALEARLRAYRHVCLGLAEFLDGNLLAAIEALGSAEEQAGDIVAVHVYLGSFYYLARQPDRAITQWRKGLRLDPRNLELRRAIGSVTGTP